MFVVEYDVIRYCDKNHDKSLRLVVEEDGVRYCDKNDEILSLVHLVIVMEDVIRQCNKNDEILKLLQPTNHGGGRVGVFQTDIN